MNLEKTSSTVKENFIVSKIYGAYYEIYSPKLGFKRAILKGKLRLNKSEERHPFVVGDRIVAENESPERGDWIIESREERVSFLTRQSSSSDKHILCANVDYVAIIASLSGPETKDGFIDRSITACYHSNVKPLIIFNKKDLVTEEVLSERVQKYKDLGYQIFPITCTDLESIKDLLATIQDKTTYLVGNSGVGKSSLINLITNSTEQRINSISHSTQKGKHTTTNSSVIIVNPTTILIDSPGIKEWGLLHLSKGDILSSFPEINKYKKKCRVGNCCDAGNNCLMIQKLDKLDENRAKSLESMIESLEIPYRIRVGNLKSGKLRKIKSHWD
ncbi:MAG TPA: ribosome small subunit-dependent GTPase A [Leptospiraceae bacterium]|nr:ribosome small subunit-dependent GTPase A [Leptospiraceae bacterium]HMW06564.1 ribosome small subunit-dependent GTPase A [Leptospiraceae bacterium]HMX32132.1 ribosome small subunit-dependent GTPase A [Leptospiraceae bacterium]HMY31246.1 ribosome small subunit-dependent GTPase A [Leptospiraceae bacterium]HMZ63268.1 ribosome small subunit-dependent GTPase A [Leptospiraceae bacterium]